MIVAQEDYFRCLIGIKTFSTEGHDTLKRAVQQLTEIFTLIKISSVYKVQGKYINNSNIHDLRGHQSYEGFTVVLLLQTKLTPTRVLGSLLKITRTLSEKSTRRSIDINLLMYEDFTVMTPQMTIPHPEFHLCPEELIPSAEIWGSHMHPILKKSIFTLTKDVAHQGWGEFFAQGKSLLDF